MRIKYRVVISFEQNHTRHITSRARTSRSIRARIMPTNRLNRSMAIFFRRPVTPLDQGFVGVLTPLNYRKRKKKNQTCWGFVFYYINVGVFTGLVWSPVDVFRLLTLEVCFNSPCNSSLKILSHSQCTIWYKYIAP